MRGKNLLRKIIAALVSLLILALLLVPALHDGLRGQPFELALLAVALTFWSTAVYAVLKRGHEALVQRLYWLHMTTAVILAYGNPAPDEVSWDRPIEVAGMAVLPALFYGFFHLLAARDRESRQRLIGRVLWAWGIASGALLLATEGFAVLLNNLSHVLLYGCLVSGFAAGIVDLFLGYLHPRSEHQRRQLQAVLIGSCLAVAPLIALYLLPGVVGNEPIVPPQLAALGLAFLPLSLSYAVLRLRLFDIDAAVDRGLVYAIMTILLAGCYALFVAGIGLLGLRLSSLGLLPSVVFFALVAAAFVPLWTWVRERVDRLVYRDRYDYARTLRELGTQLASIQPLDEVLTTVVERVAHAMNLTGAAILLRQGEAGFEIRAASGDYMDEPAVRVHREYPISGGAELPRREQIPLIAHGEVCGLLLLGAKRIPGELTGQDMTLVETLATQAAVAVENALLVNRLREKIEELELLRDQLLNVQEAERKRVAQIIHDDILAVHLQILSRVDGAISSLNSDKDTARHLRQALELGEYSTYRLREACSELYPAELEHYGLGPALAKLADDLRRTELFDVVYSDVCFPESYRLPSEIENVLYRAARQALDNVRRHAAATSAGVELGLAEGRVSLIVSDNGRGFNTLPSRATLLRRGHLGIVTLHEQIVALGGTFSIDSRPGRGTAIRVEVPVLTRGHAAEGRVTPDKSA